MYEFFLRPLLFQFDPETAHKMAINALKIVEYTPGLSRLLKGLMQHQNPVEYMGLTFPNRVGLAAGLDKNAQVANAFASLGFGAVEIGTITPLGQPGNPKPRSFRVPSDQALINRMGFNNNGVEEAVKRLKRYKNRTFILGGNIGKNTATPNEEAILDYQKVIEGIYDHVDYIVLNVSCPNVANLGKLQSKAYLSEIMGMMHNFRAVKPTQKPLVLKISPDLSEQHLLESLELVSCYNFNGVIYSNTTTSREGLSIDESKIKLIGNGGLSGVPLFVNNRNRMAFIRENIPSNVALLACGGIFSADMAKQLIDEGADMIQIYTSFIYKGPRIISNIARLQT